MCAQAPAYTPFEMKSPPPLRLSTTGDIRKSIRPGRRNARANVRARAKVSLPLARNPQYRPFILNSTRTPPLKTNAPRTQAEKVNTLRTRLSVNKGRLCRPTRETVRSPWCTFQFAARNSSQALARKTPTAAKKSSKPRAGNRPTAGKSSQAESMCRVFDASVSEAQHLVYHRLSGCKKFCIRCDM